MQVIACFLKAWINCYGTASIYIECEPALYMMNCVAETIDADQVGEYKLPCYWKFIIGADSSYVH